VRELAAELRINFNTVARAYKLLDEARLISTQRGRGTYIWEPPGRAESVAAAVGLRDLGQQYLEAAARLGATPQAALAALTALVGGEAEKESET
jgi:GntR family transcriptional regulator